MLTDTALLQAPAQCDDARVGICDGEDWFLAIMLGKGSYDQLCFLQPAGALTDLCRQNFCCSLGSNGFMKDNAIEFTRAVFSVSTDDTPDPVQRRLAGYAIP